MLCCAQASLKPCEPCMCTAYRRSRGGSGIFDLGGSELLYHWSMGTHPSPAHQSTGARRSLSALGEHWLRGSRQ